MWSASFRQGITMDTAGLESLTVSPRFECVIELVILLTLPFGSPLRHGGRRGKILNQQYCDLCELDVSAVNRNPDVSPLRHRARGGKSSLVEETPAPTVYGILGCI